MSIIVITWTWTIAAAAATGWRRLGLPHGREHASGGQQEQEADSGTVDTGQGRPRQAYWGLQPQQSRSRHDYCTSTFLPYSDEVILLRSNVIMHSCSWPWCAMCCVRTRSVTHSRASSEYTWTLSVPSTCHSVPAHRLSTRSSHMRPRPPPITMTLS